MSCSFRSLAAVAAVLALAGPAAAQTWVPVGPPGGDVRSLAYDPRDPRRVYLGTADGILYRSDEAGLRWRRLTPGFTLRGHSLDEIVVDPHGTVFVGFWDVHASGGGVARSTDGGRTFTVLSGMQGQPVRALALAPSDPETLVAGTHNGVFRSRDRGLTWQRISPQDHSDLRYVGSVAIDTADPDVIYAGTWHLPWKTTDGGRTWQPVATGMIDDSDVMTMTVDRRDPALVYATACSGIYKSVDGAGRWTRIRGIPSSSRRTRSFAQSAEHPETLYAGTTEGVWGSEDGGTTWRLLTRKDLGVHAVLALPGGSLLAGTEGAGVLRSSDGGRSWRATNQGFSERFISRVEFDSRGDRLLVGVWGDRRHGGVFWARRPEGAWSRLGPGLEGREVLSLAVAGEQVLAGTDDGVYLWPAPVVQPATPAAPAPRTLARKAKPVPLPRTPPVRPVDPSGMMTFTPRAWTGAGTEDEVSAAEQARPWMRLRTVIGGVDLHPRVSDVVAVTVEGGMVIVAATSHGLLRSADRGATWGQPALGMPGEVTALAASPRRRGLLMAATALGFFRSEDAGDRWVRVSPGVGKVDARRLVFLPTDDRVVFATTPRGLFRSLDQGATWTRCAGGVPFADITGLAVHPNGRTLYVTEFSMGGIFRSQDGGESWRRLPADGLMTERAWTVALDPRAPDRVVVASPSGGLHMLVEPVTTSSSAGSQ